MALLQPASMPHLLLALLLLNITLSNSSATLIGIALSEAGLVFAI